ncbi:MAG: cytochrome B5 [Flexistipes sinusarabici]|uniref:Cytochrome B5 n=1 Tax=Flexistipes sinusarabici TaxID=2352 RepID=A0A5D0MIX5_FLESI|nr:CopD family protein [Flexistipes sinusarabici]TYB33684.1 MAG: cytochrome B5 [Flexistipes sinusarabici]
MITRRRFVVILVVIFLSVLFAGAANATDEYAEKTGKECGVCHGDPLGGGELTSVGKGYRLSLAAKPASGSFADNAFSRLVRLIALYIHIITAFMWFGTILYVHLVLKPAYASKGLPKGEVRVGLLSMVIMAVTGVVLTYYKVPSVEIMFSSRFGILLFIKILIFIIMVISALIVVFFIGPRLKAPKSVKKPTSGEFSLADLKNFDGEEDRPAYFAYKGIVYDATGSKMWKDGIHMKRHHAGTDLSAMLDQAPHGEDKIFTLTETGVLRYDKKNTTSNLHEKVFYFMAYMNLGFVFIISLILALWQ